MNGTKGFFSSVGIWGGLIALGAGVAGIFGYAVSADDTAQLSALVDDLVAAVGGLVAIWGRIRATKKIG